jgi:hypothetical protein
MSITAGASLSALMAIAAFTRAARRWACAFMSTRCLVGGRLRPRGARHKTSYTDEGKESSSEHRDTSEMERPKNPHYTIPYLFIRKGANVP